MVHIYVKTNKFITGCLRHSQWHLIALFSSLLLALYLSPCLAFSYSPKNNDTNATLEIHINDNKSISGTLKITFTKPPSATDPIHPFIIFPFNIDNLDYNPAIIEVGYGPIGPRNIGPLKKGYSKLEIISAVARRQVSIDFIISDPIRYPNEVSLDFEQDSDFLVILKDPTTASNYTLYFRFDTQVSHQLFDDQNLAIDSKSMIIPTDVTVILTDDIHPTIPPYLYTNIYLNKPPGAEDSSGQKFTTPIGFYPTSDLWIHYAVPPEKALGASEKTPIYVVDVLLVVSSVLSAILGYADIFDIRIRMRICFIIISLLTVISVFLFIFSFNNVYQYFVENEIIVDAVVAAYLIGLLTLIFKGRDTILQDFRALRTSSTPQINILSRSPQNPTGSPQNPTGSPQNPTGSPQNPTGSP